MFRKLLSFLFSIVTTVAMGQTALPTTPNSVLQNGVVYIVSENTTITASKAGESGLQVASGGAQVVIDIKAGVTLTVTGANAVNAADAADETDHPGMPGILVPVGSTLVIIGDGTLVANGGNASNGGNGGNGENAGGKTGVSANFTFAQGDTRYGGAGGNGGDGGNGAAPGIGGRGAIGAKGGISAGKGGTTNRYNGAAGGNAGEAAASGGMGTVYLLGTVKVTATSGTQGSNGAAGNNGYWGTTNGLTIGGNKVYHFGGGGAGGGGGMGMVPSLCIGAGGAGGIGGGAGGQGGADFGKKNIESTAKEASCMGGSGKGVATQTDVQDNGSVKNGNKQNWTSTGGAGGTMGTVGTSGEQGKLWILGTSAEKRINNTTYTATNAEYITEIPEEIVKLYQITITFNNEGGSQAISPIDIEIGEKTPALTSFTVPTKDGYYFEGYFTEAVDGEKIYAHDGTIIDTERTFTADRMLHAHWINTRFTVVWDYSYIDRDGEIKTVNEEDKSKSATVKFNAGDYNMTVSAGTEQSGIGNYTGHTIATATINAIVGAGTNNTSTIYVTEEQLKTLAITAKAILGDENKYVTTNVSSHETVMSAVPTGMYMQPWSITLTNKVKPDAINVKLLSSTSADGSYTVISQLANISVACENNNGDYSGIYPVWLDDMQYDQLFYKAQIVGFEINGVSHNVAGMPLTSNVSTNTNKATLTQEVALPVIHFNLNAPSGTTPHYSAGTTEYKYAASYGETIDLKQYSAFLTNYRFEGWTYALGTNEIHNNIVADGDEEVYAYWKDAVPPTIVFTGSRVRQETQADLSIVGSLDVYVDIRDNSDGTNTQQWYYVAANNDAVPSAIEGWTPLTGTPGSSAYTVNILATAFPYGYLYIKSQDLDGNVSYAISQQYKVDNQAPTIEHTPKGKVENGYSIVCSEVVRNGTHAKVEVTIEDNVNVNTIVIDGYTVKANYTSSITIPTGLTGVEYQNGKFLLTPPAVGQVDEEGDPIDYLVYTITASDVAGNTFTRPITVYLDHEWPKNSDGTYVVTDATEPTADSDGMLPHVECMHCARYILVRQNKQWKKLDKENSDDMSIVVLRKGCVLVRNVSDIFYGAASINEALTQARDKYNTEGTADDPIGIATIIKLTPNTVGAKVDAIDLTNATLVNPGRSLILDLNGQSIDKDGVAYESVTGNAYVTILLNDGNNRASELSTDNVPYRNLSPVTGSPIQYKRTFSDTQDGKWQALYLPFDAVRPTGTKVGTVKKVEIDTEAKLWINKWEDDATDNLAAYTPYFIQHAAGEMVIKGTTNLEGYKKDNPTTIPGGNYTIAGSLTSSDRVAQAAKNFWSLTNGGGFTWVKVGTGQRPYRWVIYGDPEVDTNNAAPSRALTLFIVEPEVTGVEDVNAPTTDSADIYSISGVKMAKKGQLPPGIYIQNGKKFYVK